MRQVTEKQKLFIAEYIKDGNGTRSAIAAGYPEKNAHIMACKVLKTPHVASLVNERLQQMEAQAKEQAKVKAEQEEQERQQALLNPPKPEPLPEPVTEQVEEPKEQVNTVEVVKGDWLRPDEQTKAYEKARGKIYNETTGLPIPNIPLDRLTHVRLEIGRVYREMRAKVIPAEDGTKYVYALKELGNIMTAEVYEKRLDELEQAQLKLIEGERV